VPNFREIDRDPRWLHGCRAAMFCQARSDSNSSTMQSQGAMPGASSRSFEASCKKQQPLPVMDNRQATARKRIYTRAQIAEMARLRRKGAYSDAQWAAWEAEIVAAGREGRVIGALDADGLQ